jgi:hypothetical protein
MMFFFLVRSRFLSDSLFLIDSCGIELCAYFFFNNSFVFGPIKIQHEQVCDVVIGLNMCAIRTELLLSVLLPSSALDVLSSVSSPTSRKAALAIAAAALSETLVVSYAVGVDFWTCG